MMTVVVIATTIVFGGMGMAVIGNEMKEFIDKKKWERKHNKRYANN